MVRYKRYRRYRRNSTNVIKMKFQSFMDIHTTADEMQIISISAGGENILNRLPAQFAAYKYYKIGNISVKLVPASTLPVDPTGLSYEAAESTVDPRDQLTPPLMRITNGEDVFENISGMSAADQHTLYNNMMLDTRWFKWMLQSGVKRHAKPRYWQIGQLHQDKWPGAILNYPAIDASGQSWEADGTKTVRNSVNQSDSVVQFTANGSSSYGIFQTGHRGVLGWLPTDGLVTIGGVGRRPLMASPPEVEVMKIILPPAYKTEYYYRAYISETVYFKEPLVMSSALFRPLDVFHTSDPQRMLHPLTPDVQGASPITDDETGGNYGDN